MVMSALSGFISICLFGIALANLQPGPCPDMKTLSNFEINKFLGTWYTEHYSRFGDYVRCGTANYTLGDDGTIKFVHSTVHTSTELTTSWDGILLQPEPNEPGKLKMKYSSTPEMRNYWILETDYKFGAIIYQCRNVGSSHIASAWILTRQPSPDNKIFNLEIAMTHGFDVKIFNNEMVCLP